MDSTRYIQEPMLPAKPLICIFKDAVLHIFFVYLTSNLQDKDPEAYPGILVKKYPDTSVVAGGVVAKETKEIPGYKILRNGVEMLQFSRHSHD